VINYALIEDEPPARNRLRRMLADLSPASRCLGEAGDGESGLALLRSCRPDVLFLDIEFPPEGAFGLLARAREAGLELPPIVFATAYGHHALEAFRWGAWDYLLKPLADRGAEKVIETFRAFGLRKGLGPHQLGQGAAHLRHQEIRSEQPVLAGQQVASLLMVRESYQPADRHAGIHDEQAHSAAAFLASRSSRMRPSRSTSLLGFLGLTLARKSWVR
jgi:DNA-binding LytR/AlgR family response regulator